MKFLINSSGMLSEIEKRVYKRSKWIPIGHIPNAIYGKTTIYEIEIDSLKELMEMCIDYSRGFNGIVIRPISGGQLKEMYEANIFSDAVYEITCYNSWIE